MNPLKKLRARQQFRDDLLSIAATPAGDRFFRRLLRDCGVTFPKFSSDPQVTAFNEGKRHLAMSYVNLMGRDDPQNLIDIIEKEQNP
jgi:hypothetical protein|tara:strand:- start:5046 stop:5306 length:261 start_codon:yes stop_codon:yes gene_type:complete